MYSMYSTCAQSGAPLHRGPLGFWLLFEVGKEFINASVICWTD